MALKEIRLEHEEGAPCTAIREGRPLLLYLRWSTEGEVRRLAELYHAAMVVALASKIILCQISLCIQK